MLQPSEAATLKALYERLDATRRPDNLLLSYYDSENAFQHMGLALPEQYRQEYRVYTAGPSVVVDSVVDRQQVRSLVLPGEETADPKLRAIWDGSNMNYQLDMFNRDRRIYGRAFMTVGTNERDETRPLVRTESPLEMVAEIDVRHEVVTAAARFYGTDEQTKRSPTHATLYLPDVTVWIQWSFSSNRWVEVDRDDHRLGKVLVFLHLNRRMSSGWRGRSAITNAIRSITDGACRNLTNMQFAVEAHGVPRVWMVGAARGDFIRKDGTPMPQWEAYYNAIHTLTDPRAKIGQLTPSDLKNFDTAREMYAKEMAATTGFPASYFGLTTANPAAEGAIRAEESRLIRTTEAENRAVGTTLGWAAASAYELAHEPLTGSRVQVDWFDPATPTIAQRTDAIVKARQAGILSREGAWDEMGWSDQRKAKERAYFAAEAIDPELQAAVELTRGTSSVSPVAQG